MPGGCALFQGDAAEVVSLAKERNASTAAKVDKLDEKLISLLACVSAGSLCPMQAVIGGIAAQELMKVQQIALCLMSPLFLRSCLPRHW